ncbi:uncharacterized protein LOC142775548 [Rhipicephalus microplus]|uniref:uncharacterized protein LOC142775548 n=1 Tax=Rhipicephalus microplus TaxID=6941 RepID=UPI003F6A90DB
MVKASATWTLAVAVSSSAAAMSSSVIATSSFMTAKSSSATARTSSGTPTSLAAARGKRDHSQDQTVIGSSRDDGKLTHLLYPRRYMVVLVTKKPAKRLFLDMKDGSRFSAADYFQNQNGHLFHPNLP